MAINFVQGQVAVSDPSPTGPNATSNTKEVFTKSVKLTSANFSTTQINTLVAVLPADSTIVGFRLWVRTQLAGGGVTAAALNLGTVSAGTQFVSASALAFGTAGTYSVLPAVSNIYQNYNVPLGADIQLWVGGAATTGIPTSGELYLMVEYIR